MAIEVTAIGKDKRYIFLIFGLLLLGLIFSFYSLIFIPQSRNLRSLRSQLERKKADISGNRTAPEKRRRRKDNLERMEAEIAGYKKRFSREVKFPVVLKQLTIMARDLNIEFLSIEPLPAIELKLAKGNKSFLLSQRPIKIKIKGGYDELLRFIARIENGDRFAKVDAIKITNDPKTVWKHNIEMTVSSFALK